LLVQSTARRRLKAALGHLLYRSGLYKLPWRHRALIVLFHRVDDRYPENGITCSRAQFAALCDFFARYFEVITLSELLELLRRRADVSRRLVITFDDGYRDNYQFAAVELRKRGLPACFFVTTGFVGSDQSAPWDAKHSIRSEWMSWDEVRSLRAQGFELGAHTVTHPHLGRVAGAEAVREIAGSKAQLEAEVGGPILHFAYPFGTPDHMTEANRAIVREAGFSCCLSAHGGTVRAGDSPFRLNRGVINMWSLSPYQLGFEAIQLWL
jgi:peptidoglycan/xylan/chitin deacetylase (PgdA/CDA1 family)